MMFSALPYTPHELENARHPYELPPVHYTVVRAIGVQMGVGGDDSWGAPVHPEYIPDATKPMDFTFTSRASESAYPPRGWLSRQGGPASLF